MKSKMAFSEKSILRTQPKSNDVADKLHSYIEYTDISDLIMSYYNSQ